MTLWEGHREAYLSVRAKRYKKPWFLRSKRTVDPVVREKQLDAFLARHGAGTLRP